MKKNFVLVVLFVLPIVAYLFFASGVTNFGRLPTLKEGVMEIPLNEDNTMFSNKITVLGFLGWDVNGRKGNAFNLNQKIYKRFHEFDDFQFLMVVPKGTEAAVSDLKKELSSLDETDEWNFTFLNEETILKLFESLGTNLSLEKDLSTPYVFIVDKNLKLRGRPDDEEEGIKYGYNTASVADLNNKMVDDVKIILAEYRMARKENNLNKNRQ
ncbi:hypothetical protein NYZ99_03035 [Maribacter litopenaei]|uniref:Uncharacterized protein n=1 Tax=Maribacter litopenaei TaxID=2976127 RepID=A0ABY5Y9D0_9FLAO|nr:hypothetical protein [Maribacter litopenaei]UWX55504.1 hypothetical protein NYZ99_03035 [Maribacter litopenaei]